MRLVLANAAAIGEGIDIRELGTVKPQPGVLGNWALGAGDSTVCSPFWAMQSQGFARTTDVTGQPTVIVGKVQWHLLLNMGGTAESFVPIGAMIPRFCV